MTRFVSSLLAAIGSIVFGGALAARPVRVMSTSMMMKHMMKRASAERSRRM